MKFKLIDVPGGSPTHIPDDIILEFPKNASIASKDMHYLAYIPWGDKYLADVPEAYTDFFKKVLPNLHDRTTDVHTAKCLPLMAELIKNYPEADESVSFTGLILHDSGWSKLTDQQIADSLSYTGLALSKTSLGPKKDHAELGVDVAKEIFSDQTAKPRLSEDQQKQVEYIVLYHDIPKKLIDENRVPVELFLVCDADRFWSYTHENFWQDTIRKSVDPKTYWNNLNNELDGYFYTDAGKKIAKRLLAERKKEVEQFPVK